MSRRICTCGNIEGRGRLAMMVTGLILALAGAFVGDARAQSDTHRQDGVTLRLVALPPAADGSISAALSIELEPGWKTYWTAPGPVGLVPRLDYSASRDLADVTTAFPVPVRFREGEAQSVGYAEPVELPIAAKATGPHPMLRLEAFLGVCRELCVPVQATLAAEPSTSLSDRALVSRAHAAVPSAAGPLAVEKARWNADLTALLIEVPAAAGGKAPDAFVSAGDGWSFGPPAPQNAARELALPVLTRPSSSADLESVDILLTAGEIAQLSRTVPVTPQ